MKEELTPLIDVLSKKNQPLVISVIYSLNVGDFVEAILNS